MKQELSMDYINEQIENYGCIEEYDDGISYCPYCGCAVTWKDDLAKGFEECMRVLKPNGTLIFKWSDCQINVREILNAIPFKPLFGQQRGTTHWMTFVKVGD